METKPNTHQVSPGKSSCLVVTIIESMQTNCSLPESMDTFTCQRALGENALVGTIM